MAHLAVEGTASGSAALDYTGANRRIHSRAIDGYTTAPVSPEPPYPMSLFQNRNPHQRRLSTCVALVLVLFAGVVQSAEALHQHSGEEPAQCLVCKTGGATTINQGTLPTLFFAPDRLSSDRRSTPVVSRETPLCGV